MQTEQLLNWSGMTGTEHNSTSGLNEEEFYLNKIDDRHRLDCTSGKTSAFSAKAWGSNIGARSRGSWPLEIFWSPLNFAPALRTVFWGKQTQSEVGEDLFFILIERLFLGQKRGPNSIKIPSIWRFAAISKCCGPWRNASKMGTAHSWHPKGY